MTKGAPVHNGEKIASSINGVGRTGLVHAKRKKETWPPTYTIHQNKLKIGKRLKYKSWYHKIPRGKQVVKYQISHIAIFLPIYLLGQGK